MTAAVAAGVIAYRPTPGVDVIDAIDQYSRRLVAELQQAGIAARYEPGGLAAVLANRAPPPWVVLQYNPFRFGRWGFAPALIRDALALTRGAGVPMAIMVHEAWVPMTGWRTTVMGLWQRAQLRGLARITDRVMASTDAVASRLGHGAQAAPVAATITPGPASRAAARDRLGLNRPLTIALFGRAHPSRALDHAEAAIDALARAHGPAQLTILNLGADAPPVYAGPGVDVRSPGRQDPAQLSLGLAASDLVLLPLTDGVSTRRTTLMAALAHGRPVLGLRGDATDAVLHRAHDALVLTDWGDPAAFARMAVELTFDPGRLDAIGDAARRLYEREFDWPVLTGRLRAALEQMAAIGPAPVRAPVAR
jgi:glycosyltransferase involved in cell wall biosynthesis